jgi:hypothetical protein
MAIKMPSWTIITQTIDEFLAESGNIDCNPIGQRLSVESNKKPTKSRAIIKSILEGNDICEIALREMDREKIKVSYRFRSIDGGHRKRAIINFFANKFALGSDVVAYLEGVAYDCSGKTYAELDEAVQKFFKSYVLRMVVYGKETTDAQAGEIFRLRNTSTHVNHQEMLNSFEDNLVAILVRNTARAIPQLGNAPHALFTLTKNADDEDKPIYWQVNPGRLLFDEFGARFLCAILKEQGVTTCGDGELENMYVSLGDPVDGAWVSNPQAYNLAAQQFKKGLDFVLKYATTRKSVAGGAMTYREAVMLTRIYLHLTKEFGSYGNGWSVKDWNEFYSNFKPALDNFIGKNPARGNDIVYGNRSIAEAMKGHLGVYDVQFKIENTVEWLLKELEENFVPIEMLIIAKDKTRGISRNELETIWLKQNKLDFVTGKPLNFADAVGGHIVAHSEGGLTLPNNIVAIHKDINAKMGTMNVLDFKRAYEIGLGLAA